MNIRSLSGMRRGLSAALLTCVAVLLAAAGAARAADIRVLSNGAVQGVEQALAARFMAETGHRLLFTFGTPGVIQQKIAAGEKGDVIVLPEGMLVAMEKAGALRDGSRVALARGGIGIAVRQGQPRPDISTPDALKQALLDAPSIIYPDAAKGSPSAVVIGRLLVTLGVAEAVKPKLQFRNAVDGGVNVIAQGGAALGIYNVSEIVTVPGVALVGFLPAALQNFSTYGASVAADSPVADAAQAFVNYLAGTAQRERWIAGGFEPPAAAK